MDNISKIRSREEIAETDKWALEDLYPTDEAWEQTLATVAKDQRTLASYCGKLGESGEMLLAYLSDMERVNAKLELLANYCARRADEDTRNAKYQAMYGKFMASMVELNAACSFETPELMAISDETLQQFYQSQPGLERYRRYLTNLRRMKEHTLSAAEERILASAGEMAGAPSNIFTAFMDADMTFPEAVDSQGQKHPLSQGTFISLEESPDRELRRSAFMNLYHTIGSFRNTAAAVLNAQNKQQKFYADARKYPGALEASLHRTEVPVSVYYNLIEAIHQNLDKMHRYVRLRKKLLGVEELHLYDNYTHLVQNVDKRIPYEESQKTVYDALYPLGEEYRAILKEGLDNRWIDIYENEGKRSGAYSAGTTVHPFVLLNYAGTLDDQFTLAHEMGHALHSYLSYKNQNFIDADYVIFVAEVASTCNEALLMEYLLARTTDKKERAYLINYFLDQFKSTIYRQAMFAEFEMNLGKLVAKGETLTAEVLCGEYRRLLEMYFGPDMVIDDEITVEWAKVPHFYYNYYVFQYATGYAAAIALSQRILKEGEPAVKDYLNFLSGGCSKSPIDLLKGAGVDMTDPAPVNDALQLFDRLLDEMEALMEA